LRSALAAMISHIVRLLLQAHTLSGIANRFPRV
jgi:hypothetical protein